jgi:hypothetical protein
MFPTAWYAATFYARVYWPRVRIVVTPADVVIVAGVQIRRTVAAHVEVRRRVTTAAQMRGTVATHGEIRRRVRTAADVRRTVPVQVER